MVLVITKVKSESATSKVVYAAGLRSIRFFNKMNEETKYYGKMSQLVIILQSKLIFISLIALFTISF